MDEELLRKIDLIVERKIAELEELKTPEYLAKENEVVQAKKFANQAYILEGLSPVFMDVLDGGKDSLPPPKHKSKQIRPGQFYGRKLATAVREFLEMEPHHPKSIDEIVKSLEDGGFDFDVIKWKKELRTRHMATSVAKNTTTFARIPNTNLIGLTEWYPDAEKQRNRQKIIASDAPKDIIEEIAEDALAEAEKL